MEGGGDLRDLKLLSPRGDRIDSEGHVFGENHVYVNCYNLIVFDLSTVIPGLVFKLWGSERGREGLGG